MPDIFQSILIMNLLFIFSSETEEPTNEHLCLSSIGEVLCLQWKWLKLTLKYFVLFDEYIQFLKSII